VCASTEAHGASAVSSAPSSRSRRGGGQDHQQQHDGQGEAHGATLRRLLAAPQAPQAGHQVGERLQD